MDWILLDNKPFKKIIKQQEDMSTKLENMTNKIYELEKQNKNLENFLMNNQKLYLKHFNIICDILQDNRSLYMRQFENETQEIESLKPILNDIKTNKKPEETENENFAARVNNLIWRTSNSHKYLTTPPIHKTILNKNNNEN